CNGDSLRILGYEVDLKGNPKKQLWENLTNNIKSRIEKLTLRNLSFKGKILIAKALLISKI
ncbi:5328_t:CDS:1, partial [Cetraspora pellucida]